MIILFDIDNITTNINTQLQFLEFKVRSHGTNSNKRLPHIMLKLLGTCTIYSKHINLIVVILVLKNCKSRLQVYSIYFKCINGKKIIPTTHHKPRITLVCRTFIKKIRKVATRYVREIRGEENA